jgi:apolipoprotein N-acyltransferase
VSPGSKSRAGPAPPSRRAAPWLYCAASVAASAFCLYFSTGLGTFWPLAWIAPAPVLIFAARSSARAAALAAFAAYFLGSLNLVRYLFEVMPPALAVAVLLLPALAFAVAVLAARLAARRLPPVFACFLFPSAWAAYEFLLSLVSEHGTAGSLAYSQADFLPVVQLASLTGIWGITFLLTLVPSAIAVAWTFRTYRPLVPALALSAAALGYGAFRLGRAPAQPAVTVGLAATDRGIAAAFATRDASHGMDVARGYAGRVARLGARGAQVVVLPEKLVGVTPWDSAGIEGVLGAAARAAHVTLVAGFNRIAIRTPRNLAIVFGPDGRPLAGYAKHHLLPGPETGYQHGAAPAFFQGPGGTWGVEICKDMDFPAWSREYGRLGAKLVAVPAWDFVRDARLHSRMAVFRGVENGFALVRAAQQGVLVVSDAYGRVLADEPTSNVPEALVVRTVPPGPGATFYSRTGDWFGWLSVAILAALTGLAATSPPYFFRRKRSFPLASIFSVAY